MQMWRNPSYNFDNFLSAMQTLFYCATPTSWENIIQAGMDVTEIDQAPENSAKVRVSTPMTHVPGAPY